MNVYGLYDNYGDLFQPVAELCNEIIFDREYLENPKDVYKRQAPSPYFIDQ